jgi:hypothetical protein
MGTQKKEKSEEKVAEIKIEKAQVEVLPMYESPFLKTKYFLNLKEISKPKQKEVSSDIESVII